MRTGEPGNLYKLKVLENLGTLVKELFQVKVLENPGTFSS